MNCRTLKFELFLEFNKPNEVQSLQKIWTWKLNYVLNFIIIDCVYKKVLILKVQKKIKLSTRKLTFLKE